MKTPLLLVSLAICICLGTGMMLLPNSLATNPIVEKLQQKLADYRYRYASEKIYCHTDRSLYRPGEDIWFSVYVTPADLGDVQEQSQKAIIELIDPKGQTLIKQTISLQEGRGKGDFQVPAELNGGKYQIKAYTNVQQNYGDRDIFTKDIQLQKVVLPRVLMTLDFDRESYGPGQEVVVEFDLKNLSDELLVNYPIEAEWKIGGEVWQRQSMETDREGKAWFVQELPADLDTRDVSLNLRLEYQELTESIFRPVPVELGEIDLQFLAEGGDLISGKEGVIAFKALNEFGKGADVAGYIFNQKDEIIDSFRTAHMGMGQLRIKAARTEVYYAKIREPFAIEKRYFLPTPQRETFRLSLDKQSETQLHFRIFHPEGGKVLLLGQQGQDLQQVYEVDCRRGENRYVVSSEAYQMGIAGFVLAKEDGVAVSERLVFLHPERTLKFTIKTDKESYLPREEVNLSISIKDEAGNPVQSSLSLAVVDEQNLTFADDKQANLLAQMLLNGELQGKIEEPNYYFDRAEPDAIAHLDILMLTHGWRRFDWNQMLQTQADRPMSFLDFDALAELKGQLIDQNGVLQANSSFSILKTDDDPAVFRVNTDSMGNFICPALDYGTYAFQLPVSFFDGVPTNIKWDAESQAYVSGGYYRTYAPGNQPQFYRNNNNNTAYSAPPVPPAPLPLPTPRVETLNQAIEPVEVGYAESIAEEPIDMEESTSATLDEVVVLGYANETQQRVSTSVEITETKQIRAQEFRTSLQGAVAGVQVIPNSGPGASSRILIRGSSTGAYQNPLIVVDGVVLQAPPIASVGGNEGLNAMGLLDPNDIASISVLKGSSASTLYGSRGANGVIVVSTKSGVRQSRKITKPQFRRHRLQPYLLQDPVRPSIARAFYSPKYQTTETSVRDDFRQTVFWEGELKTDESGLAELSFHNPDQVSAFRITVEGTDGRGHFAHIEDTYSTQLPFAMKVIAPNWLSVGDQIMLPVQFQNTTDEVIEGELNTVLPTGLLATKSADLAQLITLLPNSAKTIYLKVKVQDIPTESMQLKFVANAFQEQRSLSFDVRRQGFPFEISMAGNQASDDLYYDLQDVVPGTLDASFEVFTDVYSELVNGSASILREPHGCFEQVSSSLYPNVLVLMLLQLSGKIKPAIKQKALNFIRNGYRKIKGYEITGGGFDLYGRPAAKMGLSAYGLMELNDMQKVFPEVSKPLIARTRKYLLRQRDGKGGFKDGPKSGYYGYSDQKVRNAYTVHALIEAGERDLDKELSLVRENALKTQDPYLMALASRSYYLLGEQALGDELMAQLLQNQQADGAWGFEENFHSVTRSRGTNYQIETAAFAVLAMLESGKKSHLAAAEAALSFLYKQRRGVGYFGSTQGTVLSLKAITAYFQLLQIGDGKVEGELSLTIDDELLVGSTVKYGQNKPARWEGLASFIKPGRKQRVSLRFKSEDQSMPYAFVLKGYQNTPFENQAPTLGFSTEIGSQAVKVGESVRLAVKLKNPQKYEVASPMIRLGIPAGLSIQSQQLNDWVEEEKIAYYELVDGELHLYFRYLSAESSLDLPLDLKADIPGNYKAAASVAYPYYDGDRPNWEEGIEIRIAP